MVPEMDPTQENSYKTYLSATQELAESRQEGILKKYSPDAELPLQPLSRCEVGECMTVFKAKAQQERHNNLMHKASDQRLAKQKTCKVCGEVLPSQHYLNLHMKEVHKHVPSAKRGRPKKMAKS